MTTTLSFQEVVNCMTNHQRNQWAKAGYRGLRKQDVNGPLRFIPEGKIKEVERRKAEKLKSALK